MTARELAIAFAAMAKPLCLLPTPRTVSLKSDLQSGGDAVDVQIQSGALPPQGYRLSLTARGVEIVASDDAGAFYAHQTLAQLRRQFDDDPKSLPQGVIEDWPDFPVRGVM